MKGTNPPKLENTHISAQLPDSVWRHFVYVVGATKRSKSSIIAECMDIGLRMFIKEINHTPARKPKL